VPFGKLYAKDRLIVDIEPIGALLRVSLISPLNTCTDERIEPLSLDKPRGIVTLNAPVGAA
jgi:hypothetical protein